MWNKKGNKYIWTECNNNIYKKCLIKVRFDDGSESTFVKEIKIGTYREMSNNLSKYIREMYGERFFNLISVKDFNTGNFI